MEHYISMNEVAKLQLIPWAKNRHTVKKLISAGKIKHFIVEGIGINHYKTTKEWVREYVRETKRKR